MPTLCEAFHDYISAKPHHSRKTGIAYRRAIEASETGPRNAARRRAAARLDPGTGIGNAPDSRQS